MNASEVKHWETVFGRQLVEGDVIRTWFSDGKDRITHLSPYVGPLASIFKEGAQIAAFALSNVGMTIDNGALYERITHAEGR